LPSSQTIVVGFITAGSEKDARRQAYLKILQNKQYEHAIVTMKVIQVYPSPEQRYRVIVYADQPNISFDYDVTAESEQEARMQALLRFISENEWDGQPDALRMVGVISCFPI
jgi:hypothetical protein